MSRFYWIIKGDYLQRTRSYAFLITVAISVYIAYSFVPPLDAGYTTVTVGPYVGKNNAAWIGHVTAVMTSVFLSLIGFFLVNNSIKKDIETEVGMIIAATAISNFSYLLSKAFSNFLVLLSIAGIVFVTSIGVFFLRGDGYPFDLISFVLPYLFVTAPALFFIASLAITAEVFLGRRSMIQYIIFFFLFNIIIANVNTAPDTNFAQWLDPFGIKAVTMNMHEFVKTHYDASVKGASIGFVFSSKKVITAFTYENIKWPISFLISRVIWIGISVALVLGASLSFHRFDVKEKAHTKKKKQEAKLTPVVIAHEHIRLTQLPSLTAAYGILPFIKTELLLLYRKGPQWFWLVNAGVMMSLVFAPRSIAHQFILPVLWFMQAARWSDLAAKERMNRIHYFTYASFQPLRRLLSSQIIAGVMMALLLAFPLLVRHLLAGEVLAAISIILGAMFIIAAAVCLGIVTGGKKLFEILFFLLTYCNINRIPFTDYFGGLSQSPASLISVAAIITVLISVSFIFRNQELRNA